MKKFLLIATIFCGLGGCTSESTDPCAEFDAFDREMLELINQIRAKHASNKRFLSNFNMEQVYWIQYRDTHLKAIYPEDWDRSYRKEYSKEVFNPCKCEEMTRFTKNRIEELQLWLSGGPSGQDDCPSLWN